MTWGWFDTTPVRTGRPRTLIERLFDREAREDHARYEADVAATPYYYNPEIAWYDEIGSWAYTASEYGLPGAPEVPDAVQTWRRERRWA